MYNTVLQSSYKNDHSAFDQNTCPLYFFEDHKTTPNIRIFEKFAKKILLATSQDNINKIRHVHKSGYVLRFY